MCMPGWQWKGEQKRSFRKILEHANSCVFAIERMNEDGDWDDEDGEEIEDPPNPSTQDVKPNLSGQNLKPPAESPDGPLDSTERGKEKSDSTSTRSDRPEGADPEAPGAKRGDESDDDKTVGIDPDVRKKADSGGEAGSQENSPAAQPPKVNKIQLFGKVYEGDKVQEKPAKTTSKKGKKKKKKGAVELYIPKYT